MNVLLITIGSAGDVHPFVGIGQALKRRGHDVTLATNDKFAERIRLAGLEFAELGTFDEFRSVAENPDLWHPMKGFRTVFEGAVLPLIRRTFDLIEHRLRQDPEMVVVAHGIALGARIAQEKLGVPLATVHLAPAVFRSVYEPPVLPGPPMPKWLPHGMKRALYRFADWAVVDRLLAKPVNEIRASVGLREPVRGILDQWWHSTQRVIALFPDWFGPMQPDWPQQTRTVGFPLYDERELEPASEDLERFLAQGSPPIVFTPGSAMMHAREFFETSAQACQAIGRRGILLTRHSDQVPGKMSDGIRHFEYVPFSRILPRAAALVHHGGIGTSAQAMAAGVPQVVMPFGHDQFDNAARMGRLGVAHTIWPRAYRMHRVGQVLKALLDDARSTQAARSVAARFQPERWMEQACQWLEALGNMRASMAKTAR